MKRISWCKEHGDTMCAATRGKVTQCMQPRGLHEVDLVAGECDDDVQIRLPLGLLHPCLCLLKAGGLGDVVHNYGRLGVVVVHWLQRHWVSQAYICVREDGGTVRGVPDPIVEHAILKAALLGKEYSADCGLFVGLEFIGDLVQSQLMGENQ